MKIYKNEQREVQIETDTICDKCGRSCKEEYNFCGIQFVVSGGYDSPIFPDTDIARQYDVCEYCAHEWLKTWPKEYMETGTAI